MKKLFSCHSDVSFRDSWQGIYRRSKGQERKWKPEENVSKKWRNERNFQAILEEYESDILDQTLLQFFFFLCIQKFSNFALFVY